MMAESSLEGTVDSIEILPFKLNYDSASFYFRDIDNYRRVLSNDKTKEYGIKVPQRILLTKSGELISRFSEKHSDEDIAAKKELDEAIAQLSHFDIDAKIDALPESQKSYINQKASEINQEIDNIKKAAELIYTKVECDQLLKQISGINSEKEQLRNYAD